MTFTNAWGDPVEPHQAEECPTCHGTGVYKLPYGAPDDGREVEDEDNCDCDCHGIEGYDYETEGLGGT